MVGCYYRPEKETLGTSISKEQNMFVAIERYISDVVEEHGEYLVSTEMLEHNILHHKHVNF